MVIVLESICFRQSNVSLTLTDTTITDLIHFYQHYILRRLILTLLHLFNYFREHQSLFTNTEDHSKYLYSKKATLIWKNKNRDFQQRFHQQRRKIVVLCLKHVAFLKYHDFWVYHSTTNYQCNISAKRLLSNDFLKSILLVLYLFQLNKLLV